MNCPHCNSSNDTVIDSRPSEQGEVIRRRRKCNACEFRWTTKERVVEESGYQNHHKTRLKNLLLTGSR